MEFKNVSFRMVRQNIKDVLKARKTCFALLKSKLIKHFRIRYKKRSRTKRTFELESHYFSKTKNGFAIKTLGVMKTSSPIKGINKTCRLQMYNKKYFIFAPMDTDTFTTNAVEFVALDPGIRTFQTGYSLDGIIEYGIYPDYKRQFNKIDVHLEMCIARYTTKLQTYIGRPRIIYVKISKLYF